MAMPEMKTARGRYFRGDELPTPLDVVELTTTPAELVSK